MDELSAEVMDDGNAIWRRAVCMTGVKHLSKLRRLAQVAD